MEVNEYHVRHLKNIAAPFLATIGITQASMTSADEQLSKPVQLGIVFGVMYILTLAGVPTDVDGDSGGRTQIFVVGSAALLTYVFNAIIDKTVSKSGVDSMDVSGLLFVLVFTSVIVIGSAAQLLVYDRDAREKRAKPYLTPQWAVTFSPL